MSPTYIFLLLYLTTVNAKKDTELPVETTVDATAETSQSKKPAGLGSAFTGIRDAFGNNGGNFVTMMGLASGNWMTKTWAFLKLITGAEWFKKIDWGKIWEWVKSMRKHRA